MKTNLILFITVFSFLCGKEASLSAQSQELPQSEPSDISVIVLDPGHGGRDLGAVYGNAREKDIVLDIALKLGKYISDTYPEIKVIYTRTRDVFVPLYQRANLANKNNANLFISIHVNAVKHGMVQGTETFILGQHRTRDNLEVAKKENKVILLEDDYTNTYEGFDPRSPESYIMFELIQDEYLEQSVMLASSIQKQFREKAKRIDRSVKQAGFLVLRQTTMPSVLVETGFISHPADREYLMSETGRNYLASAIFSAFSDYKKTIEQKSIFHHVTEEAPEEQNKPAETGNETTHQKNIPRGKGPEDIWFSIQIASLNSSLEIIPENFKGEDNIFEKNTDNIFRYFSGKFRTIEKAREERNRLQPKFNGAFVVAFENNKIISVKKAVRKM